MVHIELAGSPRPDIEATLTAGGPGAWRVARPFVLRVGSRAFSGMRGVGFEFLLDELHLLMGYMWDGSTAVPDTGADRMPSLFHDCACEALLAALLEDRIGVWRYWTLRRKADIIYAVACWYRGMMGVRSLVRYIGLRVLGPLWTLGCILTAKGTQ